jgi:pyruvate/2-oxoacid:ferredoxin oxidoreductase beta subunit
MSIVVEEAPKGASQLNKDTYKGKIHPDWCPGCGDFGIWGSLKMALKGIDVKAPGIL